jgi:putative endonuclease
MTDRVSIVEAVEAPEPPLGELGEKLGLDFLVRAGYRIVLTNFKVPIGRNTKGVAVTGEIDIIALDGDMLCFVEVKTRRSDAFTPVITAVDNRKQRQIIRTAKVYKRLFNIRDMKHRYDVVTVLLPEGSGPTVELTQGFWSESKFQKKRWGDPAYREF